MISTSFQHESRSAFTLEHRKIAAVTVTFWVLKILSTTLGETAGDFISMTLNLGYYVGFFITFGALVLILFVQVSARQLHPILFWLAIVATTTAGTEISDLMDRSFGLGYLWGSVILTLGLAATFSIWDTQDAGLDVDRIRNRDTEVLFWIAVVFSNSLGTAFGDFLTDNLKLTYLEGALVMASVIEIVIALHYLTRISHTILFWTAFIFTRPFGATFGDFLTKPVNHGGLELPRGAASLITGGLIVAIILGSGWYDRRRHPQDHHPLI